MIPVPKADGFGLRSGKAKNISLRTGIYSILILDEELEGIPRRESLTRMIPIEANRVGDHFQRWVNSCLREALTNAIYPCSVRESNNKMMRLTIFWRLVIGYLIIFILVMIVGIYAIIQLKRFNTVTQYILNVDNRILEYEKNLVDLTLSQHRFLKKYIITGDRGLYNQFFSTKEAFSRNLDMALAVSDTPFHRNTLAKIKEYHDLYQSLVGKENDLIQSKRIYSKKEYESEKERLVDGILEELELLEIRVQQDAHQRMKEQGEAGDSARTMAVILASLALGSIIITSFLITRSITAPLGLLRIKNPGDIRGGF